MQVRISKPTKSSMQSGDGRDKWILEYINPELFIEDLMGRTSSRNMMNEIRLEFNSKEEAINFAKKKNFPFEVILPAKQKLIKKSYASNFK